MHTVTRSLSGSGARTVGRLSLLVAAGLALSGLARAQCFFTNDQPGYIVPSAATCNVGINMTSAPGFKLDFGGTNLLAVDISGGSPNAATFLFGGNATGWKLFFGRRSDSGATKFLTIQDNGLVGVGTSSPIFKVSVSSTSSQAFGIGQVSGPPAVNERHLIMGYDTTNNYAVIQAVEENVAFQPLVLQKDGGSLLVGSTTSGSCTPNPCKLWVQGSVGATSIAAQYQDVAEWVPSRNPIEPATVVVLDPERSNEVVAATTAYDTRVAGVVSAKPGLILGVAGDGKTAVATTGRVRVRVDATNGPIRVGDLLVTSDREGYAMRSEPLIVQGTAMHRPGTLIGKALEPLASGTGEILVLLSLQ